MAQVQAITAQLKTAPTQPPEQNAAFPPPEQKTAFDKVRFSHIAPLSVFPICIVGFASAASLIVHLWFEFFSSISKCVFPGYTCHADLL